MVEGLVVLVGFVINTVVLGFIMRRLLGAPVGWPRTILVSALMATVASPLFSLVSPGIGLRPGAEMTNEEALAGTLVLVLVVAWGVAVGLVVLVIGEALVPTGSLPHPIAWLRGGGARRRRSRRYAQIVAIAVRHGLGGYLRARPSSRAPGDQSSPRVARSLRLALSEAGVAFVKLGQMLATRPDLVGHTFSTELGRLQSDAAPEPWASIERAIDAELGRPWSEVFATIDPDPVAAASVAQVHRATLRDGSAVVIKVQRPGALAQVTADMDIVLRLSRWLNRSTSWGRSLGVHALAQGFRASLAEELDYRIESDNTAAIAAGLAPDGRVRVPTVRAELSGERLLVMDVLPGQPLSRAADQLAALDDQQRSALADALLDCVLRQVMVTGVFHADLHQGNVFVDTGEPGAAHTEAALGLLDFGSVGRLDDAARTGLGRLLYAIDRNDSIGAADALIDVLDAPATLDDRAFEREVGQLVQRFRTGFGSAGSTGMFGSLFGTVVRFGFGVPAQVAAALRALAALEGTLATLSPGLDLVTAARARGRDLLADQFSPERVKADLTDQLVALLPLVQRLPRRLGSITDQLERGRLGVSVRVLADPGDRRFLLGLVQQLTLTVLSGSVAIGGVLMIIADTGPQMLAAWPDFSWFNFAGFVLLFFGFVLAARALAFIFTGSRVLGPDDPSLR